MAFIDQIFVTTVPRHAVADTAAILTDHRLPENADRGARSGALGSLVDTASGHPGLPDGSVVAQLGHPDMKVPIQYALTHPERRPLPQPPFDLAKMGSLTFRAPDRERFPALDLALRVSGFAPFPRGSR